MGPFLARIRDNMHDRQEARQERREERQERRSTKHDIPPLAEEKILNTNRTEMQQQFLAGADTGRTQPPKVTDSNTLKVEETRQRALERLANVSALDYVDPTTEKVVRPTLVQQAENPKRVSPYGPPSREVIDPCANPLETRRENVPVRMNGLGLRGREQEQPFAEQKEPPKMRENTALLPDPLQEMKQMPAAPGENVAELPKQLKHAPTNGTGETDWNKLGKGYEEFIASEMKIKPPYWTNNSNLKQDSNSEVFKKFFENAQKISGSKLSMDSPDGLAWIKKVIDEKLVTQPVLPQEVPKKGNSNANDAPKEAKKTDEQLEAEIEKKRAERAAELKTEKSERNSKR